MNQHGAHSLRVWLAMLCGIAIAVALVMAMAGPSLLAESTRAVRPFGGVALRGLVWVVIAFAAYRALVRQPRVADRSGALASGRTSSRGR